MYLSVAVGLKPPISDYESKSTMARNHFGHPPPCKGINWSPAMSIEFLNSSWGSKFLSTVAGLNHSSLDYLTCLSIHDDNDHGYTQPTPAWWRSSKKMALDHPALTMWQCPKMPPWVNLIFKWKRKACILRHIMHQLCFWIRSNVTALPRWNNNKSC